VLLAVDLLQMLHHRGEGFFVSLKVRVGVRRKHV
jgi:hypothetical protein